MNSIKLNLTFSAFCALSLASKSRTCIVTTPWYTVTTKLWQKKIQEPIRTIQVCASPSLRVSIILKRFKYHWLNRPWWPSGVGRVPNSSRQSLKDPGSNPCLGLWYWSLRSINTCRYSNSVALGDMCSLRYRTKHRRYQARPMCLSIGKSVPLFCMPTLPTFSDKTANTIITHHNSLLHIITESSLRDVFVYKAGAVTCFFLT